MHDANSRILSHAQLDRNRQGISVPAELCLPSIDQDVLHALAVLLTFLHSHVVFSDTFAGETDLIREHPDPWGTIYFPPPLVRSAQGGSEAAPLELRNQRPNGDDQLNEPLPLVRKVGMMCDKQAWLAQKDIGGEIDQSIATLSTR